MLVSLPFFKGLSLFLVSKELSLEIFENPFLSLETPLFAIEIVRRFPTLENLNLTTSEVANVHDTMEGGRSGDENIE